MAINIKFDLTGNPEPPTIILAKRNSDKLGQLEVDPKSIDLNDKFNDTSEFSFTLYKYIDGRVTNLWNEVVDFKLVYCKEWDMWFEITVELDEETETIKTVMCTQLGQAELSQINLDGIHINEEGDSNWSKDNKEYKSTILYCEEDTSISLLHRLLKDKAPHYSIKHVDDTIKNIQRTFSFDDTSIYDAFMDIAEEIGCLFVFHSNSDESGKIQRTISVYDLHQNCLNPECNHRGEFIDKCPKCGGTNIKYGYGEDTTIFVTADELAASGIQLSTDTDSVKNCFKLEAGDDLMTATIRNCNPNGTDYIWYFSESAKKDMSSELVEKIESYDEVYKHYYDDYDFTLDVDEYNNLINKYIKYDENLKTISESIKGYSSLMNVYYDVIDLGLYLESGLMPSIEMSETTAKKQAALLTRSALSPVAVTKLSTVSLATVNNAVLTMAKTITKPTYRVQVNSSELSSDKKTWKGNFIITNYSDDEDTAISSTISVTINDDEETFIKQKLEKSLSGDSEDYSITGLFEKDYNDFCLELKCYALNPLNSFYEACQACIDILIEQGTSEKSSDLYTSLYKPYYNKLLAIQAEIKIRENEVNFIKGVYDVDNNLIKDGFQTIIEKLKNEVGKALDFKEYLGTDLWLEFCLYRREDKYSNDNYVSDGLSNAELFEKASEFINVAKDEIYKSAELQHSISASLKNLLAIPKFKPLVKYFNTGNWIRVQIDEQIYKLRLLEYNISYSSFDEIPVEFSDVIKIKNGITDVESVLSQASSMATSYSSVQRQADQGNNAQETIENWVSDGLNSAFVQIQNNDNEEITFSKNGLLGRSYDDVTESYSPEQIKLTHNIIAYTDDNWESVRLALGKHEYSYYDESSDEFVNNVGYGLGADFVTAGVVKGSQIIGGDIYSDNYSASGKTGSYLNLNDGTFSFAGGKLTYDNDGELSVDGKITSTSGTIGGWTIGNKRIYAANTTDGTTTYNSMNVKGGSNYAFVAGAPALDKPSSAPFYVTHTGKLKATDVDIKGAINATSGTIGDCTISDGVLKVKSVNIDGRLTASQIDTDGLIAENISGTTLPGKTISGGSINIGDGNFIVNSSGKMTAKSGTFSGDLNASGGTFAGTLSAVSGTFTTLTAGESTFSEKQVKICTPSTKDAEGSIYIGASGVTDWEDITIRPSSDNLGNIGTAGKSWDILYVKNGAVQSSDRNYKKDISVMGENQEKFFNLLSPVIFKFIDSTYDRFHYGFISQEVENAIIESGLTTKDFAGFCKNVKYDENGLPVLDENGDAEYIYSLRYNEFIALNTHMIQKLQKENQELKERIVLLEEKIEQL